MPLGAETIKEAAIVNFAAGLLMLVCTAVLIEPYGIQGVSMARIVYGVISGFALLWIVDVTTIRSIHEPAERPAGQT